MDKLIDMNVYPVSKNLKALLKDKTTKKNIIFATPAYSSEGNPIKETEQMTEKILKGFAQCEIQPRVLKNREQQQERTRAKAEVFTPSWICNKMNNQCDEEWFGRKNVFNIEQNQGWQINTEKVKFDTKDGWKKYVDSKRLEITCGEAPYIVSRYDAATGEIIEIKQNRIAQVITFIMEVCTLLVIVLFPNLKDFMFLKKLMSILDTNVLLLLALFFTFAGQWATEIKIKDIENRKGK